MDREIELATAVVAVGLPAAAFVFIFGIGPVAQFTAAVIVASVAVVVGLSRLGGSRAADEAQERPLTAGPPAETPDALPEAGPGPRWASRTPSLTPPDDPGHLAGLLERWRSPELVEPVLERLVAAGEPAVSPLRRVFLGGGPHWREAGNALARIGSPAFVPLLQSVLRSGPSPQAGWAAEELGRSRDPAAVSSLVEALDHRRSRVRAAAAAALGSLAAAPQVSCAGVAPALAARLRDKRDRVRVASAWALAQIAELAPTRELEQALPVLKGLLGFWAAPSPELREHGEAAIAAIERALQEMRLPLPPPPHAPEGDALPRSASGNGV